MVAQNAGDAHHVDKCVTEEDKLDATIHFHDIVDGLFDLIHIAAVGINTFFQINRLVEEISKKDVIRVWILVVHMHAAGVHDVLLHHLLVLIRGHLIAKHSEGFMHEELL